MRATNQALEVMIGEIAARESVTEVRCDDHEISIEISEEIDETRTIRFERAPYDRVEIGTATMLGTGFPHVVKVRAAAATISGSWFKPSDDTLMRIEDLVRPPRSVWPWVGFAVGVASFVTGVAIWWML